MDWAFVVAVGVTCGLVGVAVGAVLMHWIG